MLARLEQELRTLGARTERRPTVLYGWVPASPGLEDQPALGFVAHVDTSPEMTGRDVRPRVHASYNGQDITFPDDPGLVLSPREHPALAAKRGHDVITASGQTLLGADDKAGVAIVMTLVERLVASDAPTHGPVSVAFTTDEEIGHGVDAFDIALFGADAAFTLDGGEAGELEIENFNALGLRVTFSGFNTHPGYAAGKMANAMRAAGRFLASLPMDRSPERTADRAGFVHPWHIDGGVDRVVVQLIARDFDFDQAHRHARQVETLARESAAFTPGVTVVTELTEQYRNMHDAIAARPDLIARAEAAIRRAGIEPVRGLIRGGTDGARLSAMGLPTPNLFAGQHNIHSRLEWVTVQDMEAAVRTCVALVTTEDAESTG